MPAGPYKLTHLEVQLKLFHLSRRWGTNFLEGPSNLKALEVLVKFFSVAYEIFRSQVCVSKLTSAAHCPHYFNEIHQWRQAPQGSFG